MGKESRAKGTFGFTRTVCGRNVEVVYTPSDRLSSCGCHEIRVWGTRRGAASRRGTLQSPNGLPLELYHLLSLQAFRAFCNGEFYGIALAQGLETSCLYCGVVDKNIISGSAFDKTVPFFVVKPLDRTLFFHFSSC
jgi:hypothetical protein